MTNNDSIIDTVVQLCQMGSGLSFLVSYVFDNELTIWSHVNASESVLLFEENYLSSKGNSYS